MTMWIRQSIFNSGLQTHLDHAILLIGRILIQCSIILAENLLPRRKRHLFFTEKTEPFILTHDNINTSNGGKQ